MMVKPNDLLKYFKSWNESELGFFKVAPVTLSVTKDAEELERVAKETANEIEAEVLYAWDLGTTESEAWWIEWGGFSLEEEVPYYAAISLPEAMEKIAAFNPKDNEYECDNEDEFKALLFNAYDEDLTAKDLKRGFKLWLEHLDEDALVTLNSDFKSWTSRAN
jgi:hypothetical protein